MCNKTEEKLNSDEEHDIQHATRESLAVAEPPQTIEQDLLAAGESSFGLRRGPEDVYER